MGLSTSRFLLSSPMRSGKCGGAAREAGRDVPLGVWREGGVLPFGLPLEKIKRKKKKGPL
jgi:hypothetical protein